MLLADVESKLFNGQLLTSDDLCRQIEKGVLVPKRQVDEMMKVTAENVAEQFSAKVISEIAAKNSKTDTMYNDLNKTVAEVSAFHGKKKHKK